MDLHLNYQVFFCVFCILFYIDFIYLFIFLGPQGVLAPWVCYDLQYLTFLQRLGPRNVTNFFCEPSLRVRQEILETVLKQVLQVQRETNKRIKDCLLKIGQRFYRNLLVMLDNGIGVVRTDRDKASRLNISALLNFAMDNYEWKFIDHHIIDEKSGKRKLQRTKGSKAAPSSSMFELFRWSEACFRLKHGNNTQETYKIGKIVAEQISIAQNRVHAIKISHRTDRRREFKGISLPKILTNITENLDGKPEWIDWDVLLEEERKNKLQQQQSPMSVCSSSSPQTPMSVSSWYDDDDANSSDVSSDEEVVNALNRAFGDDNDFADLEKEMDIALGL